MRVLLVDDQPRFREALVDLIETEDGFDLAGEAADGLEALAFLERESPSAVDLVVTDIHMPRLDGVGLTRAIKARWPELPVVGLTATGDPALFDDMRQAGAADVIPKLAEPDDLCARLHAARATA